jgi:capsular exopolysaccharide synthesis family protein
MQDQSDGQGDGQEDGDAAGLEAERRSLLVNLAQINTQLDALGDSLTTAAAGGELLGRAEVPKEPASPRTALNVVLAGVFGLLLGAAAALLRDRFDDAVHDEAEVRRALGNAPLLGRIPRWPEQSYEGRLVTLRDSRAPASEAYQRLAVNVRFMLAPGRDSQSPGAIVLCTSAQDGEGKTVSSCNLAVAAARLGLSVVLVDADLRRPAVAPRFGLEDPAGLSDLLMSDAAYESHLVDASVRKLKILPAGTVPPNPVALLASVRMKKLLDDLAHNADLVIVDSPPALTGADTLELANHADMVMLVARAGVSRRRQLVSVTESLRHVAVSSVGVVYNGVGDGGRTATAYHRRTPPAHKPAPTARATAENDQEEASSPRQSLLLVRRRRASEPA